MQDTTSLEQIIDASIPLVIVETFEEKKAEDLFLHGANKRDKKLARWSLTDGLTNLSFGLGLVPQATECNEPVEMLRQIKASLEPCIYLLCDFHPYLKDQAEITRLIKDIALNHLSVPHMLVFISHRLTLPKELSRYATHFSMPMPTDDRIMQIVREEAGVWSERNGNARVQTDNQTLKRLVATLQGISAGDVRRLVRSAIWDDGALTETDLPRINRSKFQMLDLEGIVSFETGVSDFSNVGGLDNLKNWLTTRREAFQVANNVADRPKGILLLGVQGGGKSLAAKAVAGLWGLALLRLDVGALYNKFHGETERNLREALALADSMSPCVLWLDEIEKGMAQEGNDNGTSQRLLGTLLTWMAERTTRVFIVATSNDISRLPPELIRKGRLDEIFFVDLPELAVRRDILSIHLKKRDLNPYEMDLEQLATLSEGFSGAEIEQAIVASQFTASAQGCALNTKILLEELNNTSPLSVIMAEQIMQLRVWAENRTVPA